MEENISDKLGGNLEECNMKYEVNSFKRFT